VDLAGVAGILFAEGWHWIESTDTHARNGVGTKNPGGLVVFIKCFTMQSR
jgi:hypothetical protein